MNKSLFLEKLEEVQEKVSLKEGTFGILKNLAVISRFPETPMRKVAQESDLPVPICVAIRNEFVKHGWVVRGKKGASPTQIGEDVLKSLGGLNKDFECSKCNELGTFFSISDHQNELEIIKKFCDARDKPRTEIDQSFATSKTSLFRVLYMSHKFDLFRKNFAFIGDSDLTSIALALLSNTSSRITVFDIDLRLKSLIELANEEHNLNIEFVNHNLREPIPKEYIGKFDCFSTDPPYTIPGLELFISRGLSLLNPKQNGAGYLSFGVKPPKEMLELEKSLLKMNCVITDILPNFNSYVGAQKIAGKSSLYRFETIPPFKVTIPQYFGGLVYTGEINPVVRFYECKECKKQIIVGKEQLFSTIEELKNKGCPFCNHKFFTKTSERKME